MPLPLIPFLIKGAIVAAKALSTKAAVAKTAAVATKTAIANYGAAQTAVAVATGLVYVGGVAWSVELINRARRAYELVRNKDYAGAAQELSSIAASIKTVGTTDFAGDLRHWIDAGKPLDGSLVQLTRDAKALADEASATAKF